MSNKMIAALMRVLFLTAAVVFMAAMVYRKTPRANGTSLHAGDYGTKLYGFYDYVNGWAAGWYSTPVIVSLLFLFALTGILAPRRRRRR